MNFFLDLYNQFKKMGMNSKDLDHMLNALPWKKIETKEDGTEIYECKINEYNKN